MKIGLYFQVAVTDLLPNLDVRKIVFYLYVHTHLFHFQGEDKFVQQHKLMGHCYLLSFQVEFEIIETQVIFLE